MDASTISFLILTPVLVGATLHAWRQGAERRDLALLGTVSALCGVGAAVTAIV